MSDPRTSPSIFTRGAVDLGALRSANQAPPPPSAATAEPAAGPAIPGVPGAPGGATVIDVTEATFQTEVLERSLTTPVIIDLWATWCEPCKQLSPVLERLAVADAGSWVLAKVDIDANPRLAQALRVQSIPMVVAVVKGQLVEGFAGVLPETQVRQYVDAVLRASGTAVAVAEDPRLSEADEALMSGDLETAERAYRKILADSPADAVAESGLAQVELFRRVEGTDAAVALTAAQADPDNVAAQLLAADVEVLSGEAGRAYRRLVDLVRRTSGDDRELVRKHLVSLFTMAGPDDPEVATARRQLASALF